MTSDTNLLGNSLNTKNPYLPQTVTVQGFAWNATTRGHTDEVRYEARNTIEAKAWMKRNRNKLTDLIILHTNEAFLLQSLLQSHGHETDEVVL